MKTFKTVGYNDIVEMVADTFAEFYIFLFMYMVALELRPVKLSSIGRIILDQLSNCFSFSLIAILSAIFLYLYKKTYKRYYWITIPLFLVTGLLLEYFLIIH